MVEGHSPQDGKEEATECLLTEPVREKGNESHSSPQGRPFRLLSPNDHCRVSHPAHASAWDASTHRIWTQGPSRGK